MKQTNVSSYLRTIFTNSCKYTIYAFDMISFRYGKMNCLWQAFYGIALLTPKMKMILGKSLIITFNANCKILFTIFRHDFMHLAVFAKAVQYSVNRSPVNCYINVLFNCITTHRLPCSGQ